MKNISILFSLCFLLSCSAQEKSYYGMDFELVDVLNVDQVLQTIDTSRNSTEIIVQGIVESSCQKSGCWMQLKSSDDRRLMVTFKDYGFFVPKKMADREVAVRGLAEKTVTSIEDLKHYAADEGLTQEEIDAIDEAEVTYSLVADGVKMIER